MTDSNYFLPVVHCSKLSARGPSVTTQITLSSKVRPIRELVSSKVGDELVILNLKSGIYFGLNPTGRLVWENLTSEYPLTAVRDLMVKEYDVHLETCERDVVAVVQHMAEQGLVEVLS